MIGKSILVVVMDVLFVVSPSAFAGSIIGWGNDAFRQLSDIPSGNDFIDIGAGAHNAYAVRNNGSIIWNSQDLI